MEDLFKIDIGKLVYFHFQRNFSWSIRPFSTPMQHSLFNRNTSSKKPNLLYVSCYKTSRLQRRI